MSLCEILRFKAELGLWGMSEGHIPWVVYTATTSHMYTATSCETSHFATAAERIPHAAESMSSSLREITLASCRDSSELDFQVLDSYRGATSHMTRSTSHHNLTCFACSCVP